MTVLLAAIFLVVGPVVARYAGDAVYRAALDVARIAQRDHVRVNVVLKEDTVLRYTGSEISPLVRKPVSRGGADPTAPRTVAMIGPARPGSVGTVVSVWTDATGNPTMRSRTVDDMQVGAIWTGLVALLGLGGVLTGAWMLVRMAVNRRRLAWWQGEVGRAALDKPSIARNGSHVPSGWMLLSTERLGLGGAVLAASPRRADGPRSRPGSRCCATEAADTWARLRPLRASGPAPRWPPRHQTAREERTRTARTSAAGAADWAAGDTGPLRERSGPRG